MDRFSLPKDLLLLSPKRQTFCLPWEMRSPLLPSLPKEGKMIRFD